MSDVPIGVFLSGGLDSSAIASIASGLCEGPLQTFSVGFHEPEGNELPHARAVAEALGARHREVCLDAEAFFDALPGLIWNQDEPMAFSSGVPLHAVSRLAREHVKVVLTGEGADELFLGYNRYRVTYWNERIGSRYASLPAGLRRAVRYGVATLPRRAQRYASRSFLGIDADGRSSFFENFAVFRGGELTRLLADAAESRPDPHAFGQRCYDAASGGPLERMSATDLQTYLGELLMKQDRMSMAASIESRVPFLDDDLVDLVVGLPGRLKLRGWRTKAVLRAAVAGLVPAAILSRRKMGFPVPLSRWLRGTHRGIVREFVTGPRTLSRGLFRREVLHALVDEHDAGAADHGERLWLLINLEIWQRIFCDGEAPADILRPVRRRPGRTHATGVDQGGRPVAAQHGWAAPDVPDPV
jgi:asparagine synthase (glutamine-hydrolysing)